EGLIWLMGWVLDREPQTGEAVRLLLLVLLTSIVTWLSFDWRGLALRTPSIRKRLLPEERYAGRYLQAVARGDGVRYAIVHIYYNAKRRRFEVAGRNYDPSGERLSSFKSNYVVFPSGNDDKIEFVWQGTGSASGHTLMHVETEDEDYIEGDGRVQKFGAKPE